jgi:hypothetical protein
MAEERKAVEGRVRAWHEWLISDAVLGTLVVLFTVATAFAAYRASIADIEGDDLDVNAQNNLLLGTTTYLEANMQFMQDMSAYNAYLFSQEDDAEAAAAFLAQGSSFMQDGLARENGPFDEAYESLLYGEALTLFDESRDLQEQGDNADSLSWRFQEAAFMLAIGLAITAWASLFDTRPKLRLIFTLLALPFLVLGLALVAVTYL